MSELPRITIKTSTLKHAEAGAAYLGREPPRGVACLVWDLDEGETIDDAARVLASVSDDATDVAEAYAEQRDNDEGEVSRQRLLVVRHEETGAETRVEVEAERVVRYNAKIIDSEGDAAPQAHRAQPDEPPSARG